ncbi:hypothetical protein NDN08_001419 [Rhodosorus marinus]|uniref:Glycosyltransferase 61 catalytic domain-containing protein n=1 Tax=Rhodosorus marinus TaxID=101924 RepID=A0AAV8UQU1_9RHOD|nr:hypothetical protein NDN08_001419 [Rhodosorus marinus]
MAIKRLRRARRPSDGVRGMFVEGRATANGFDGRVSYRLKLVLVFTIFSAAVFLLLGDFGTVGRQNSAANIFGDLPSNHPEESLLLERHRTAGSEPHGVAQEDRPVDPVPNGDKVNQHKTSSESEVKPPSDLGQRIPNTEAAGNNTGSNAGEGVNASISLANEPAQDEHTEGNSTGSSGQDLDTSIDDLEYKYVTEQESMEFMTLHGALQCFGSHHTADWLPHNCENIKKDAINDSNFATISEKPKAWLAESQSKGEVLWVPGTSVVQKHMISSGNIAHFAGRIFYTHHLIANINSYAGVADSLTNVLIWPGEDTLKRFADPEKYGFWHQRVFEAVTYPHPVSISTLDKFLDDIEKTKDQPKGNDNVRVHLMDTTKSSREKFVCFERALIPGYLKGRFFIRDPEYPSSESSTMNMTMEPHLPRDAIKFRAQISGALGRGSALTQPRRKILLLDRAHAAAARRSIEPTSKESLRSLVAKLADDNGFAFEVVVFDGIPITEQEEIMKDAAIAIGVHGANLVNSIFQPAWTVMLELMPYGFDHEMYEEGGGAGLKYFKHHVRTGVEYEQREMYTSTEECVRKDVKCKVHYRDHSVALTKEDLDGIEGFLGQSFAWLQSAVELGLIGYQE